MKYILAMLCCLSAQDAFAQAIRDQSLTPSETSSQPNVTYQHDYLNPNANAYSYQGSYGGVRPAPVNNGSGLNGSNGLGDPYANEGYGDDANDSQRREFMDIFCDPNAKPMATSEAMSSCIESSRQQTCAAFNALPNDVQRVLDHEIGCIHSSTDVNGNYVANPSCGDDDHRRLVLLKKYWRDQQTSYAIVFLPDDVLKGPAECVTNNGGY